MRRDKFEKFISTTSLLIFLVLFSGTAKSQMVEARELLKWCAEGTPTGDAACSAYIMGIADAVSSPTVSFCTNGQSREKIRQAVVRHMMTIPAQMLLDFQAVAPVTLALQKAFPCAAHKAK